MMHFKRLNMMVAPSGVAVQIGTLSGGFVEKTVRIHADNDAVIL